jgi:hypothetical protein
MIPLQQIVTAGPRPYQHTYMQTMVSCEVAHHELFCPDAITTLAKNHPDAQIIIYGDDTLGIEIAGRIWAVECPHPIHRPHKTLPHEVWQYINLAMAGREYLGGGGKIDQ